MNDASVRSRSEACFWLYSRTLSAWSCANCGFVTFARIASLAARSSRSVCAAPIASGVSLPVAVARAASAAPAAVSRFARSASQAARSFAQSGRRALAAGAAVAAAGADPPRTCASDCAAVSRSTTFAARASRSASVADQLVFSSSVPFVSR